VKRDVTDERLQDYLDGRLTDDERAEMDVLVRDDADLAARVEALTELGRALREDAAELSPGFYTRARARFEESVRPRTPRGFRLLSWEFAGLSAAVVLVAAIFVPELTRNRDLGRSAGAPQPSEVAAETTDKTDGPARQEKPELPQGLGKAVADDDSAPLTDAPAAEAAPDASLNESITKDAGRRDRRAETPIEQETEISGMKQQALPADEGFAPSPAQPPPAAAAPAEPQLEAAATGELRESAARPKKSRGRGDAKSGAYADMEKAERDTIAEVDLFVVELPREATIPAGLTVVDERSEWESRLAGPAGASLRRLGPPDDRRRLILIGRPDSDCSSLRVQNGAGYRVVLSGAGSSAGCAFLLPHDDVAVSLEP
jgi:anti-sigma factor RsiW